jgi:hypothetical protein
MLSRVQEVCDKASRELTCDWPPPAAALRMRDVPDNLLRTYNPRVNTCIVVPLGPDSACVKICHTVHDFAVF